MPSPIIVGKVYANWCGHCKDLKPEWKKLKKMVPKDSVQFIEIEETESAKRANFEKKIKAALNVSGFPTIFKVQFGKPVEYYTGERNAQAMRAWILSSSANKKSRRNTFKRPLRARTQRRWFPFL
jgi:thiol-disulfide isomerase/thioredoxin